MFFQIVSTMKVNLVAKIMQSAYLCVIFPLKHRKLPFLLVLTWFLILGKIQYCGQDGDYCWWRHRPPGAPKPIKYTSSCSKDQRPSTKGKIVLRNTATCQKLRGRGSIHPPPLYHGGGMNLLVCPRVNQWERFSFSNQLIDNEDIYRPLK